MQKHKSIGTMNWASGGFISARPTITEFEKKMRELRLRAENCSGSDELRRWCKENSHRCYIPESLLKTWGIPLDSDFS
jgi:hypothetical protein